MILKNKKLLVITSLLTLLMPQWMAMVSGNLFHSTRPTGMGSSNFHSSLKLLWLVFCCLEVS